MYSEFSQLEHNFNYFHSALLQLNSVASCSLGMNQMDPNDYDIITALDRLIDY